MPGVSTLRIRQLKKWPEITAILSSVAGGGGQRVGEAGPAEKVAL